MHQGKPQHDEDLGKPDHYWTFYTNQKWIEHQREVLAWEKKPVTYTRDEYIRKNKDFLIQGWAETFWPNHVVIKPDKGK